MVQGDALEQFQMVLGKGVPLQSFQVHVVAQVHTEVCTGGNGPTSVLEFFLVDVDGDARADEMLQAAGVVEVQMAENDGFDVFDVVAGRFDCCWQPLGVLVFSAREYVGQGRAPFLR
jgi:hypothetical protein